MPLCETLLADADRLIAEQRYAVSILTLSLALESAIADALSSMLIRQVVGQRSREDPEVQMLHKRYGATIGSMPLGSLRNVMINILGRKLRAKSIPESLQIVEQVKRFATTTPSVEQLASIDESTARAIIDILRDTSIMNMRSTVLHYGQIPADRDVKKQRDMVADLLRHLERL